jgi:L-alanine-DL-glutamate epimerase-like enolase superfamily enzyme
VTARGTLTRREIVLLRIRTGEGMTGLGEGVPMSLRGGTSLCRVAAELEAWGSRATAGDPGLEGLEGPARIAAETALADAEARLSGIPLHELLSPGSSAQPVTCNATLTAGAPADVLAQAERWAAEGFRTFKLKLGEGDEVAQVRAVRRALGEQVKIRIDANESWTSADAASRLAALEPFGIELAEQPVAGLEAMAGLRSVTSIPLVADESVNSAEDAAEAARLSACDAVTVKLSKTGSLDAALGGHLPTYLSSALDGPVGIAAAAHVVRTLPETGACAGLAHGLATSRLFSATVAEREARFDGPLLLLPEGPGLGVEIDEVALNRHRL